MKFLLFILSISALLSCTESVETHQKNKINIVEQPVKKDLVVKIDTALILPNGFKLEAGQKENFGNFNTYSFLKLTLNNTEIITFKDSLEFEFGDGFKNYPTITKLADKKEFQVAIEVNDRPNKNYLLLLIIKGNKIIKIQQVPTFIAKPANLDDDEKLEVAGFWDYAQVWGDNNNITAYNPIIFYELTENGLLIDSVLTKERNTLIFGKFEGYQFSEDIEVPVSVIERFNNEINRIKNK